jgi:alpha-tubulin suppressor-like RCC1 family protein
VQAWSEGPYTAWCVALRSDGTVVAWGRGLAAPLTAPPQIQGAVDIAIGSSLTAYALLHTGQVVQWDTQNGTAGVVAELTGIAAITGSLALRTDGSLRSISGAALSPPVTGGVVAVHGGFAVRADGTVFKPATFGTSEAAWTTPALASYLFLPLPQGLTNVGMRLTEQGVEGLQTLAITRDADTALRFLATGGGTLTPPFARGVTGFTQTVRQPQLSVWAAPVNAATMLEVRSNGGSWTRLATGPSFSANRAFLGITTDGGIAGNQFGWGSLSTGVRAVSVTEHSSHSLVLLADGLPLGRSNFYPAYPSLRVPFFSSGFSMLAAGDKHALALRRDGTLAAWGENNQNQTNFFTGPLSNVVQVAAGRDHSLALLADGTVRAAGANNFGQGSVPAGINGVVAIAAGFNHNLALRHDGSVVAWGDNTQGQATVPLRVKEVIAVSAGSAQSMALTRSGRVHSWGGDGNSVQTGTSQLTGITAIMAGSGQSYSLRPDGTLAMWGGAYSSDLAVPSGFRAALLTPAAVLPLLNGINTVEVRVTEPDGSASSLSTIEVMRLPNADLTALQLAAGALTPAFSPGETEYTASVSFSTAMLQLQAAAAESGAVVRVNGVAVAGGSAEVPLQPGVNLVTIEVTAEDGVTQRTLTVTVTRRPASSQAALRFLTSGTVPLAPAFDPAVLNYTQPDVSLRPLLLHALPNDPRNALRVRLNAQPPQQLHTGCRLTGGDRFMLAIKPDDTVAAWGNNADGQCYVPPGLTDVVSVAAGTWHSVALRRDGSVVAWGRNAEGQTDVPTGPGSVVAIAAGGFKTMALREDGTVAVWGTDYLGQSTVPAGLTNVVAIAAGYTHCLALKRDGTLATWGETILPPSDPGPVVAVAAGWKYSAVLRRDGTVTSWGTAGIAYPGLPPVAALGITGATAIRSDGTLAAAALPNIATNAPTGLAGVSAVWGNEETGCAVTDGGSFVSWGDTQYAPPAGLTGKTGRSFAALALQPGANVIEASVPAEDGVTTADYRIAITRNPNTVLTSLVLAGTALTPVFSNAVTEYTAAVPASLASVTLTAAVEDSTSRLEVNGTIMLSGQAVAIPLAHGANEITVRVTAEDGVTTLLRRIAVTRAFWSSNAALRSPGAGTMPASAMCPPA